MAAMGFVRMSAEVSALAMLPPADPDALARRAMLLVWKDRMTTGYLALIAAAVVVGRTRAGVVRRED